MLAWRYNVTILGRKQWTIGAVVLLCGALSQLQATEQRFESREAEIADALAKNGGPLFVDWPKPDLTLVFSGEMDGYLEPCGCAGLENQKGGFKRRHTFLKQLADKGWPVVALDTGGQIRRFGPQADIKYDYTMRALAQLNYQAVGLGLKELQLDSGHLAYVLSNFEDLPNPVVSANIGIFDDPSYGFSSRYRVIETGGKKIGVTSVLGKKHQTGLQNARDIFWIDPVIAIEKVLPELQREDCDFLILLTHAEPDEATALAKQFPQFQFVATAGADEPPNRLIEVEGSAVGVAPTLLVEAGHKGMYVMVVGLYNDPQQPIRLQRVPLDHRFEDSEAMQELLIEYQNELKTMGLSGLGLAGNKHPVDSFVGSGACADCHTEATEIFEDTPHAHATQKLVELEPPRHFDPECLSCHVVGWNPQEFFPYASGYASLEKTPHLTDNGCENCHGPGASHVAAENGDVEASDAELERLRTALRLTILDNEGNMEGQVIKDAVVVKMCLECHDLDNSPEFDFQEYWKQVEHYGKD